MHFHSQNCNSLSKFPIKSLIIPIDDFFLLSSWIKLKYYILYSIAIKFRDYLCIGLLPGLSTYSLWHGFRVFIMQTKRGFKKKTWQSRFREFEYPTRARSLRPNQDSLTQQESFAITRPRGISCGFWWRVVAQCWFLKTSYAWALTDL